MCAVPPSPIPLCSTAAFNGFYHRHRQIKLRPDNSCRGRCVRLHAPSQKSPSQASCLRGRELGPPWQTPQPRVRTRAHDLSAPLPDLFLARRATLPFIYMTAVATDATATSAALLEAPTASPVVRRPNTRKGWADACGRGVGGALVVDVECAQCSSQVFSVLAERREEEPGVWGSSSSTPAPAPNDPRAHARGPPGTSRRLRWGRAGST